MRRSRWVALILAGVFAFMGVACSGDDDSAESGFGGDSGGQLAEGSSDEEASAAPASRSALSIPPVGPSVIKTATLEVEVPYDGFQDAFRSVVAVAQKKGGFVLSSTTSGDDARRGSITLRVPAETFESALNEISSLGEVGAENISADDVSEEFIDLEARLRNLKSQETVILGLMEQATTIPETINVQDELTRVQLDIEQLRGRLRYLEDQTALSTISVNMSEAGIVAPEEPGTLARAWAVIRDTTHTIVSGLLIGGAAVLPILVVLLGALLFARWVWPKLSRVTTGS